ncbi:MAG TPA: hypothetical protein VD864_16195 [Nocardioides sp.]|nr:hypothetical protein [Nocardioides sp.]
MLRRSLVALSSVLALVAPVLGQPASADLAGPAPRPNRVTVTDVTDDVWLWVPGEEVWVETEHWPTADNLQAEATHWGSKVGNRVVITMDFVDLRKAERQEFGVKIVTPRLTRVAWVVVKPGKWKGDHLLELSSGKSVSAAGVAHRVSYRKDSVLVEVPRARLGNPPWVRVAFINLMFTAEGGTFMDHPHDASYLLASTWETDPPLSGRLYPVEPGGRPAAG